MENKIGIIYQIIASVIGITIGTLVIIYRKKFLELQKGYFSKHKDFLNQKMLEGLKSKSDKNNYLLMIVVAIFIIILSVMQLVKVF